MRKYGYVGIGNMWKKVYIRKNGLIEENIFSIHKKSTFLKSKIKFIFVVSSQERKTRTTKSFEKAIIFNLKQNKIQSVKIRGCRKSIDEVDDNNKGTISCFNDEYEDILLYIVYIN